MLACRNTRFVNFKKLKKTVTPQSKPSNLGSWTNLTPTAPCGYVPSEFSQSPIEPSCRAEFVKIRLCWISPTVCGGAILFCVALLSNVHCAARSLRMPCTVSEASGPIHFQPTPITKLSLHFHLAQRPWQLYRPP